MCYTGGMTTTQTAQAIVRKRLDRERFLADQARRDSHDVVGRPNPRDRQNYRLKVARHQGAVEALTGVLREILREGA